jgi:hypothetical protein
VSCGPAHSSARELVAQGNEAKLVAETLAISRSSLYYRRQPCGSFARPGDHPSIEKDYSFEYPAVGI